MQYHSSQTKPQKAELGTKIIDCLIEVEGGKGMGIQFNTGIKPSPLPLCIYFTLGLCWGFGLLVFVGFLVLFFFP